MEETKALACWFYSTIYCEKQLNLRLTAFAIKPERKEQLYNKSEKRNRTSNFYELLICKIKLKTMTKDVNSRFFVGIYSLRKLDINI